MKFDLSKKLDQNKAKTYFERLITQNKKIELKSIQNKRSTSINSYLHVVISLYSINFGYTLQESKTDLKSMCSFMVYHKKGSSYLKQTSKMNNDEVSKFIEWIRNLSSNNGFYIPDADEYKNNKYSIDKEIDNHKIYL